jgi:hypothetical protein
MCIWLVFYSNIVKTTRCHNAKDHNINPHCLANSGFTYRIYTTAKSYGNACMAPDWIEFSGCCNTNIVLHHKFVCRSWQRLSHRLNFNFIFFTYAQAAFCEDTSSDTCVSYNYTSFWWWPTQGRHVFETIIIDNCIANKLL